VVRSIENTDKKMMIRCSSNNDRKQATETTEFSIGGNSESRFKFCLEFVGWRKREEILSLWASWLPKDYLIAKL